MQRLHSQWLCFAYFTRTYAKYALPMAEYCLFPAHVCKVSSPNSLDVHISCASVQKKQWNSSLARPPITTPPWSYVKVIQNQCFGVRPDINFSAAGILENPYRRSSSSTLPECSRLVSRSSSGDPIATPPLELLKSSPKSLLWGAFWHQFLRCRQSRKLYRVDFSFGNA